MPQGLIHDWIGASFIPNTTIDAVFAVLDDYNHYNRFYNPAVIHAQALGESDGTQRFSLLLAEKMPFYSAAIKSEYAAQTIRAGEHDWYTISYSTRIQQIEHYGQPGEHELPPDTGAGFVWRLYSIERFEERDGGVYTELEAIALSRNVPFALQWLVKPILRHLPRNSMLATLQKTRDAVCEEQNSKLPELANVKLSPGNDRAGGEEMRGHAGLGMPRTPATTSFQSHPQN